MLTVRSIGSPETNSRMQTALEWTHVSHGCFQIFPVNIQGENSSDRVISNVTAVYHGLQYLQSTVHAHTHTHTLEEFVHTALLETLCMCLFVSHIVLTHRSIAKQIIRWAICVSGANWMHTKHSIKIKH